MFVFVQRYDFQVLIGVSKKGIRPTLPATCPEEFKMMITSCWSGQAEKRPDCGFLLIQLNMIKGTALAIPEHSWHAQHCFGYSELAKVT